MQTSIRDKHFKLDQKKLDMAKKNIGRKTETEVIEKALDRLILGNSVEKQRRKVTERIISRRNKLKAIDEDVSKWIREGREERNVFHEA